MTVLTGGESKGKLTFPEENHRLGTYFFQQTLYRDLILDIPCSGPPRNVILFPPNPN